MRNFSGTLWKKCQRSQLTDLWFSEQVLHSSEDLNMKLLSFFTLNCHCFLYRCPVLLPSYCRCTSLRPLMTVCWMVSRLAGRSVGLFLTRAGSYKFMLLFEELVWVITHYSSRGKNFATSCVSATFYLANNSVSCQGLCWTPQTSFVFGLEYMREPRPFITGALYNI